jgi:DNA-binding transcriptional LysR family regulator
MAPIPTISLEQWRALVAVVDDGGYAAAAEAIHKSQSAVTYAVQQVEKLARGISPSPVQRTALEIGQPILAGLIQVLGVTSKRDSAVNTSFVVAQVASRSISPE